MAKSLGLDLGPAPEKKTTETASKKASSNTTRREGGKPVDLNFKVDLEFKRDFRSWAAAHDMTQKEVLERAFAALKDRSI